MKLSGKSINFLVVTLLFFYSLEGISQPCSVSKIIPKFTYSQNCNTKTIHFTNSSVLLNGSISSISWNFGDGFTSNQSNPIHTYSSYGTYWVTLTINHSSGCIAVKSDSVQVLTTPLANFSFNFDSVCPNQAISFTNLSSGIGLTYKWFFRDSSNYNAISNTSPNPVHNFNVPTGGGFQTFNIKLEVKNSNGCIDSITHPLVLKQAPYIDFSEDGNFKRCENIIGVVSDTAIIFNFSDYSTINSYQINWGDGGGFIPISLSFNNLIPATHIYTTINNHPITIITTGNNGCISTFKDTFKIITIPLPDFTSLAFNAGCIPFTVFTINNSAGITSNTSTIINWGDNTIDTLTIGSLSGDTLFHTYTSTTCINNTQQPYNIILTTKNECGSPFKSYGPVEVYAPPQAHVNVIDDSVCIGNPINFLNQTNPNFCAANPRTLYTWDLGDTIIGPILAPLNNPTPGITYSYSQPGIYNIILTAENTSPASTGKPGCGSSSDSLKVYIFEAYAGFTFDTVCLGSPTHFTDISILPGGYITSINWDFGDSTYSSLLNPNHIYPNAGKFIVTHSIGSSLGCIDFITDTIVVDSLPYVNFSITNTCFKDSATFLNLCISNADSIKFFNWNFGDGSSSVKLNPTHYYQNSGNYNVKLKATNSNSCQKDTTISITILPSPIASFYTDTVCSGYQRVFTNNSHSAGSSLISNYWTMGDGTGTCIQTDTTYIYSQTGTYPVNLQVTDSNGCKDDTTINIYLGPVPIANFTFDTVCFGSPTHFTNSSNNQGVPITSYFWDFDDTFSSTNNNPNHIFGNLTIYNVLLKITNINGCIDTISKIIFLDTLPKASFSHTTVCKGDSTFFSDISFATGSSITTWNWNFGDGNSSFVQHPKHLYQNSGNYNVTLNITDNKGCTNDTTITIYVKSLPIPSFTVTTPCKNQIVNFHTSTNNSTLNSWNWNFGNNNASSNIQNPLYTYNNSGVYNVTLTVTDTNACIGDTTQSILIYDLPEVNFTYDTNCLNEVTHFIDLSTDTNAIINIWKWNFGDGTNSVLTNPIHNFLNSGTHSVNLKVFNSLGCYDSISKTILVDTLPIANFTANNVVLGGTTIFTDFSISNSQNLISWFWDFGDGNTSNNQNPTHNYVQSDTFNVMLIITNSNGCIDTVTKNIIVFPVPHPVFSVNPVCLGTNSAFIDNSASLTGSTLNWKWNFGDGIILNTTNPVHQYASAGNYTVWLIITDINGNKDSVSHIAVVYPNPVANFVFDTVCSGYPTKFIDSSSTNSFNINQWKWIFGDGSLNSTLQNPLHQFSVVNTITYYTVNLTATDSFGCKNSTSRQIIIYPPVVAEFISDTICTNSPILVTDSSHSSAGNIVSWDWNFGGIGTSNSQNPVFTFSNVLNTTSFNVRLIAKDTMGCRDTISHPLLVFPLPVVNISVQTACLGSPTVFTDSSYSNGGGLSTWFWNFDSIGSTSLQNPSFIFPNLGIYNTTLTVTDINGCINSKTITVNVDSIPEANFTFHGNCAGGLINFTDITISHGSPNTIWNWDFGDSYFSSLKNPVHYYTLIDTFNVTLTVGNNHGCSGKITKQVYVNPSLAYDFYADTVCFGMTTHFVDSFLINTSQITTWLWNFGDGTTSTIHNPDHIFNNSGIYNVSLTILDTNGCMETILHNVKVNTKPIVDFTSTIECDGAPNIFSDNTMSTSLIINYLWNFGDGFISNVQNPNHLYANPGNYMVKLIATNANGCIDSVSKNAVVIPKPLANFHTDDVCKGFPVVIIDSTVNPGSFINTWNWNFGDGDSLFVPDPTFYTSTISHSYLNSGNYSITLTVSNNACSDTTVKNIQVYPGPEAGFIAPDNCLNDTTYFSDTSSMTIYPITSWNWNFGDGNYSIVKNPNHVYSQAGIYTVTLSVTDSKGCIKTTSKNITIYPLPIANFNYSQTCLHDSTYFTDISFGSGANINNWNWNFGDASPSAITQNTSHYYAFSKNYNVRLIVKNTRGCIDTLIMPITVDSLPQANFTNSTVCQGNQTLFTNTSVSHGSLNNTWNWKFGDGVGVSFLQNPFYTYQTHGVFNVKLLIVNQKGCKDSISKAIQVDTIPLANFKADSACLGLASHFTNLSQSYANLALSYSWNFGDNTALSTLANPIHTYANPGIYQVSLTVTDAHNCQKSIVKNIVVYNLPTAGFTAPSVQFPGTTTFTNTSTGNPASIVNWSWDFGNNLGTSSVNNPNYSYTYAGSFNTRLIVTDIHGCKDTVINTVLVYSPSIFANFTYSTPCENSFTLFTDSTVLGTGNIILNWQWNFGDSTFSILQNPVHQYQFPGIYNVSLIVTGLQGSVDTINKLVTVFTKPVANFDNTDVCLNTNKTFTNLSGIQTGNIIEWKWDFGNGDTSNTLNHSTVYYSLGNFSVKLIVKSDNGCIDSITKIIDVKPLPVVVFSSDISDGCVPIFVTFKDSSAVDSGFITTWNWSYGDGATSVNNSNQTSHSYLIPGNYNVSVTATSNYGCKNTLTIPNMISVYSNPVADFFATPNITSILEPKIYFTDNSTGGVTFWNWYFDDGTSSNVQSPNHIYSDPGTYFPFLMVTTLQGCTDTISKRVVILKDATFYAPTGFTPNNDGYNDIFQVYGFDLEKGDFEMMIFNRWGEMVFQTKDYHYGWNGISKGSGEICPDGVYVWKINYTNGLGQSQKATGHITLIR